MREPVEVSLNKEEPRRELADVWNDKGLELLGRREYESAQHAFAKAVAIKPEFTVAWYNMARVHCHKGKKEEAIGSLKRAIKLDPDLKAKIKAESLFRRLRGEKEFEKLFK
jgi:tetratricopeptide (TPR) repeat protein